MPTNTPTTPTGLQYPPPQLTRDELIAQIKAVSALEDDLTKQFYSAYDLFMSLSSRLQEAHEKANALREAFKEISK